MPEYDLELYRHKKMKSNPGVALTSLKAARPVLADLENWQDEAAIHDVLLQLPKDMGLKNGQVLWPVRIAISGKQFTPGGAIEIAHILGKDETLARIDRAIARLEAESAQ